MTSDYFADIFGVFSKEPHKYDLAWHIRGDVSSALKFTPMTFPEPAANGYCTLTNVRQASVPDAPWSMTFTRKERLARLHAASASATKVILADGGPFYDKLADSKKSTAPTILQRRDKTSSTIYGNALDYSDSKEGFVKGVEQAGGLDTGYGLLKVQTIKGIDLCFVAYRPGAYKVGGLETDALQAFVQMDGKEVNTLYIAGGKLLKTTGGTIERNTPGLAYVEKTNSETYIVGNPSPTEAAITVALPALAQLTAFNLDDKGERIGVANIKSSSPSSFTIQCKANSKVEFAHK